jgi:excisionase family DNA binding protein
MQYLGGMSKTFFYRLVKSGRIRQLRLGEKVVRYDTRDLNAYIRTLKTSPSKAILPPR